MAHYNADAIVLRTYKLGEADRIVNLLSPNLGKIRGVAKGVRRTGSRFGGRLEPYGHVTMQLYAGRSLDTITQVELLTPHARVREDWVASACAATMAEACDHLAQEEERATGMFLLLKDALGVLDAGPRRPAAVLDAFLLRLAGLEGFKPSVSACVSCGSTEDLIAFHIGGGGVLCRVHASPDMQRMAPETLVALQLLAAGDWTEVAQGRPEDNVDVVMPRSAGAIVRSYLSHHLSTTLKAWESVPR